MWPRVQVSDGGRHSLGDLGFRCGPGFRFQMVGDTTHSGQHSLGGEGRQGQAGRQAGRHQAVPRSLGGGAGRGRQASRQAGRVQGSGSRRWVTKRSVDPKGRGGQGRAGRQGRAGWQAGFSVQTGRQAGMVQGSDRQVRFRVQAVRDPVSGGGWHSGASKGQGRDVG